MWNNLQDLKMKNILTMCTNSIRHSMCLSKLLGHGMNALVIFSLTMVLGLVKPTQLSSQKSRQRSLCMPNLCG
jgi:hypothetical protein